MAKSWFEMTAAEVSRIERAVDEDGLCTAPGSDPDAWFPAEGTAGPQTDAARTASLERAAGLCEGCPVLTECRLAALNRPDREGVFGGLPGWALDEIRRLRPIERAANRERFDIRVINGEIKRGTAHLLVGGKAAPVSGEGIATGEAA